MAEEKQKQKREIVFVNSEWNEIFARCLQMIQAVCFLELMQFTLDVVLRAHWFTLFHSESIHDKPSAHKQRMQLCRLKTSWGVPSNPYSRKGQLGVPK